MRKLLTCSIVLTLFTSLGTAADLSQEELVRKSKYFLKWDADGDQKLNLEEFTEMTRAQFERNGKSDDPVAEARKRFKRKDINQDAMVDWAEFLDTPGAELP